MADQKISQLNNIAGANVAADDEFVIVDTDANETKAIRADNIRAAIGLATTDSPSFAGLTVNSNPIASAGSLSHRNKIINGNFDIWQRGTSGSSGYIADRWRTLTSGSTAAISRQAFALGQTDVPNEPEYFHRVVVTSSAGAANLVVLQQRVEDVRTLAGQTATLSFWAKADAAKNIAVEFSQDFGSGGSASVLAIDVTTCALTTSWQKFTITAPISSISGKTIGNQSSLDLTFWFDAGSNFNTRSNSLGQQSGTFDIAQVQLEAGSTATPFEVRSYGQELALCQRYYTFFNGVGLLARAYDVANGSRTLLFPPSIMRTTPTCTVSNDTGGVVVTSIETGTTSPRIITLKNVRSGYDEIFGVAQATADAEL